MESKVLTGHRILMTNSRIERFMDIDDQCAVALDEQDGNVVLAGLSTSASDEKSGMRINRDYAMQYIERQEHRWKTAREWLESQDGETGE